MTHPGIRRGIRKYVPIAVWISIELSLPTAALITLWLKPSEEQYEFQFYGWWWDVQYDAMFGHAPSLGHIALCWLVLTWLARYPLLQVVRSPSKHLLFFVFLIIAALASRHLGINHFRIRFIPHGIDQLLPLLTCKCMIKSVSVTSLIYITFAPGFRLRRCSLLSRLGLFPMALIASYFIAAMFALYTPPDGVGVE